MKNLSKNPEKTNCVFASKHTSDLESISQSTALADAMFLKESQLLRYLAAL